MQEYLPHAARGKHRPVRQDGFRFAAFLVQDVRAHAAIVDLVTVLRGPGVVAACQKVNGGAVVQARDARVDHDLGCKAFHDGPARVIAAMQDARCGMPALAGQVKAAVFIAVKGNPGALDEHVVNAGRPLTAEKAYGFAIVVIVSCYKDIFFQGSGVIAVLASGGSRPAVSGGVGTIDDAPLGQFGVAVEQLAPGVDKKHFMTGIGQRKGGGASGNARTNN